MAEGAAAGGQFRGHLCRSRLIAAMAAMRSCRCHRRADRRRLRPDALDLLSRHHDLRRQVRLRGHRQGHARRLAIPGHDRAVGHDRSDRARRGQHVPADRDLVLAGFRPAGVRAGAPRQRGSRCCCPCWRCCRRPSSLSGSSGATCCSRPAGCSPRRSLSLSPSAARAFGCRRKRWRLRCAPSASCCVRTR